ncbi:phage tail tape measure C-terminal domain-containing protein [Bradyrhizobium neotropicale]|uniref:Bacteriophage tail tape measure N-terminal domain-containing protein n=1 Tax=Bradyrhizobium neotropicale TaxID=1497615 RepID=A0A176Z0T2_9BRAD|nr:phage tail tape measure C-terminal domain-containing protein [Bradyrhizobium neotropicale]OAF13920.1 hypothetical protein AXW67_18230 [Bradyrhizobium neotropicale]
MTPALNIPIKVTGLDTFKSQMNETSVLAANAARAVTATTIKMSAGFLASQGAAGAATLAFGRLLTVIRPIALGVTAVVDTFAFLKKSVELAGQQIEAFNAIASKAGSAGVSTDFFQRFTKSAPNAALSIDHVTEALQNFNKASTEQLGGSDLQQRIDALVKAGNFAGNGGVGQFAGASTTETRLRAIVSLIDQAMQKGERLAALDIASKAFGEPVAAALRADNGYLDQMLQKADAMNKAEIVSQDDIGRAIQLRDRMDEAQKILADKWKPIQQDMAQLGINFKGNWTSVVEVFAELVGLADKLYGLLKQIPDGFAAMGSSSIWTRMTEMTGALGLNSDPASLGIETGIDAQRLDGTNRLRAAMMNPANVQRAMQEASNVQSGVRRDTSKAPGAPTANQDDKVDSAINSLRRHTQQMEADTKAVGLGEAALARFRAEAQETAAVQANGGKETADQAAKFRELQNRASEAADALAKAKVQSQIDFGRQTALMSPEDVQIAQELRGVYGNDVPRALASTEAAAIRVNNALKGVGDAFSNSLNGPLTDFEMGTKSATQSLQSFVSSFARSLLQMANQALIVKPLLSGFGSLFGLGSGSAPVMSSGLGAGTGGLSFPMFSDGGEVTGPGGPRDDRVLARLSPGEYVINAESTRKHRAVLEAINRGVPRFADGGLVGGGSPAAPMIASHQSVIAPSISVSVQGNPGMSEQDHARMGENIAQAAQHHIRTMIADELRTATRPGGWMRR